MNAISHIPVTDPDADIIAGLQAGDDRALNILMARHLNTIHALAARLLGDRALAEDVTQTVFLKTWEFAPDWVPGRARLLTWMRRVTTHHCLDMLKKKAPIYTDTVPDHADERDSVVQSLIKREATTEIGAEVSAAMARLPERQRTALTLSYYEELSQKEGARIMEISESAYESLLVRARKALRQAFEITDENQQTFAGVKP